MSKGKVLLVCSNASKIEVKGGGLGETGPYLNETVVPILSVIKAGYDVVLATPNATKPPLDAVSRAVEHFGGDTAAFRQAEDFFAKIKRVA